MEGSQNGTGAQKVTGAPSSLPVTEDVKNSFLQWCKNHLKITVNGSIDLFHEFSPGYRGVLAVENIPEGVDLLRVHRRACIGPETDDSSKEEWGESMKEAIVRGLSNDDQHTGTVKEAKNSLAGKAADGKGKELDAGKGAAAPPHLSAACFTVLRLLHELGKAGQSSFEPYLRILPRDHRIPLEWNEQELALLKATSAEPLVAASSLGRQFAVYQDLVRKHPALWDPSVRSESVFAKAVNWVRSRGFTVHGEPYLIPCADMFNHDPARQGVAFGEDAVDSEIFVMRTVRPIAKGDEVFSSFGRISNAQLVNSYGFVLKGNPYDAVQLPASIVLEACHEAFVKLEGPSLGDSVEDGWEKRLAMLKDHNSLLSAHSLFLLQKFDMLPQQLMEVVQLLLFTEDELAIYAAIVSAVSKKLAMYPSIPTNDKIEKGGTSNSDSEIGVDALSVATALIEEETRFLKDLKLQVMNECMALGGDEDCSEDDEGEGEESENSSEDDSSVSRPKKKARKSKGGKIGGGKSKKGKGKGKIKR